MSTVQGSGRGERLGFGTAFVAMALLVAGMWLLEGVDQASGNALDDLGIRPRTDEGLVGIFVAPWLHGGWAHLLSNTVPFLVLGIVVLLEGWRSWARATLIVLLTSGAAVWLLAPTNSVTLGASGIVFGWLVYLLVRGFFTGSPGQIATGVVVFLFYGGMLLGVLPSDAGVSWQAHLGGALGGFLAARSRGRALRPRTPAPRY
jgi:membrane associated rhomboid family serine protease